MVAYYNQGYKVKTFEMDIILRIGKQKCDYGGFFPAAELERVLALQKIDLNLIRKDHVVMFCFAEMLKKEAMAINKDIDTANIDALLCDLIKKTL